MIQLCITVSTRNTAIRVAEFLTTERLVLNAHIFTDVMQVGLSESTPVHTTQFLVSAVTKALLFTTIEKKLIELMTDEAFELYAVPVVNMNWEQADRLRSEIEKV